jgi:hypothetical protein
MTTTLMMIATVHNNDDDDAPIPRPRNADSIPTPVSSPSMRRSMPLAILRTTNMTNAARRRTTGGAGGIVGIDGRVLPE